MSKQLICNWLGLPPDCWPPDHYLLLGLDPGEWDAATIEQHVHQRLETVRRYQLLHPEPATEAMNRLAQAFICLTDPKSKKAYDATLLERPERRWVVVNNSTPQPMLAEDMLAATQLDLTAATVTNPAHMEVDTQVEAVLPTVLPPGEETPAPPTPPPEKVDSVVEAARFSTSARRGLGTKRALYHRIARTRQLLRAWDAVGKYVGDAEKRVAKPAEATEMIQQLTTIRALLRSFPPLLGAAGQPGYLVIALARMQVIVPTFQTLLPSQREALARDWETGKKLLVEHREFLRQELRAMRKRGPVGLFFRAVKGVLTDQPGMILLLLALIALNVALWKYVSSTGGLNIFPSKPPAESSK